MDQDATWYGGGLDPGHIVLDGDLAPPWKAAWQPPLFGPCLLWPNGRPSQQLMSSCMKVNFDFWKIAVGRSAVSVYPLRGYDILFVGSDSTLNYLLQRLLLRDRSIAIGRVRISVCMYVCLCAPISGKLRPNFTKFSSHDNYGRGAVLIWRQCNSHVMYFRFCGWRHVFTQYGMRCTAKLTTDGRQSSAGNAERDETEALKLRTCLRCLPLTDIARP